MGHGFSGASIIEVRVKFIRHRQVHIAQLETKCQVR
jgi:hypothetical protein